MKSNQLGDCIKIACENVLDNHDHLFCYAYVGGQGELKEGCGKLSVYGDCIKEKLCGECQLKLKFIKEITKNPEEFGFVKKDEILKWCYKNNSIPLKDSKLKLVLTDGGWVNVLELQKFMDGGK